MHRRMKMKMVEISSNAEALNNAAAKMVRKYPSSSSVVSCRQFLAVLLARMALAVALALSELFSVSHKWSLEFCVI